ncbi:RraA-like protein [Punctularia strigosozonata HHB-11173 SS5]|uniref:RraA-like protein n=1 Tax=Punctularia strigosozonata (strain HHB-11173) TaxID=741275 RepID=UPI00044171B7|nr:RraA-like protein [Punctularia strigosozonata HHB-11173 SS5]EIN11669.1 RraA-like protein [Punctularia strigosozonata HHB-11173 SS5]
MSTSTPSPLAAFSTCEISDALAKLGIAHGGHIPDIHQVSAGRTPTICAPAYTVKMVLASDKDAPKSDVHFVDAAPEGHVVVIDAPPQAKNAVWGGLMTAGAQARGAVGVIISGRCRDLAEHREAQFPVFARGTSTVGQSPHTRPSAINVTVTIGDETQASFPPVTIQPGDWMVADENGIVCVPRAIVTEVVDAARRGREIDAKCMEDIKEGLGVQASFKKHRGK